LTISDLRSITVIIFSAKEDKLKNDAHYCITKQQHSPLAARAAVRRPLEAKQEPM
jgi:hypothetical protein